MKYEAPTVTYLGHVDPDDPCRVLILDETVHGGWRVRLWRRVDTNAKRFDALLIDPDGRQRYSLSLAPTAGRAIESVAVFLMPEAHASAHVIERALQAALDRSPPKSRKPEEEFRK